MNLIDITPDSDTLFQKCINACNCCINQRQPLNSPQSGDSDAITRAVMITIATDFIQRQRDVDMPLTMDEAAMTLLREASYDGY